MWHRLGFIKSAPPQVGVQERAEVPASGTPELPGSRPPSAGDRKGIVWARNAGAAIKQKLHEALSRKPGSAPGRDRSKRAGIDPNLAKLIAQAQADPTPIVTAATKLARDMDAIMGAFEHWAGTDGFSLEAALRRFVTAERAGSRAAGALARDGLRAAVTGLTALIRSDAPEELKALAGALDAGVVFRSGARAFNVNQFGAQNSLRDIDELNLAAPARKAVAERFAAALADMRALYQAFEAQAALPERKFDPEGVIALPAAPAETAARPAIGSAPPERAQQPRRLRRPRLPPSFTQQGAAPAPAGMIENGLGQRITRQQFMETRKLAGELVRNQDPANEGRLVAELCKFAEKDAQVGRFLHSNARKHLARFLEAGDVGSQVNLLAKMQPYLGIDPELRGIVDDMTAALISKFKRELESETDPHIRMLLELDIEALGNPLAGAEIRNRRFE